MNGSWFADLLDESRFLQRYPAFAGLVATLDPVATDRLETMAIGRHVTGTGRDALRLYVNADYFDEHPQYFAGILQHELHHVLCGHLDEAHLHRVPYPQWMELAMETCANENITEPTPPGIVWQSYREFGLCAGQSTMERYSLLVKAADSGRLRMMSEEQLDLLDPGWRSRTPNAKQPGSTLVVIMPNRGSALPSSRRPHVLDGSPVDDHRPSSNLDGAARGIGDALDRGSDGARPNTWKKDSWRLGSPSDENQLRDMQLRIRAFLHGERGGAGDQQREGVRAAKELQREVSTQAVDGRLAWTAILKHLLPQFRNVWPTYMRPNRRFPDRIGELPGRARRARKPHLLVAVDTSASMSRADLGRIRAEVARLSQHAVCTIAECDAEVHRVHHDARLEIVTGGGDTDFGAVFELLGERSGFDGVIYFTDGVGKWPNERPREPVLWVLIGETVFDCSWGTVVRTRN